jgi:hypothetical protein
MWRGPVAGRACGEPHCRALASAAHFRRAHAFGNDTELRNRYMRSAGAHLEKVFNAYAIKQITHGLTVSLQYMLDGRAYVYVTFGSSGPGAPSECHGYNSTWDTLYAIGTALDECARNLGLDADRRVWLQRLVQEAYMSLIDDMDSGEAARAGPGVPGRYLYS